MFGNRASQKQLASLSRNLGISLNSGVPIIRSFELAARKSNGTLKQALDSITDDIKSGSDVTSALRSHDNVFPPLFINLVRVGETTGSLPEVLKALGTHYENNVRLKKEFLSQITMPMIQLVVAILVIALLIFVLGVVANMTGQAVDVLGWGLLGTSGAMIWLSGWAMAVIALFIVYRLISASDFGSAQLNRALLKVPVIGDCLQAFAVARFSWAFHLTQEAGMPIGESLESSFGATSNGAFIAAAPDVIDDVERGETLTEAFSNTGLFPVEFQELVLVAETAGTVPEALHELSPQFEDQARRSLQAMTTALSWVIWGCVAAFIIYIVFTIAFWYLSLLNDAMEGI